jgi:hypothetical protein
MIILILLFILIKLMECLRYNELCYPDKNKKYDCHGIHSFNCADIVCTKNQYSCQLLSLFSELKGIKKINYEKFMKKIQNCPEPPKVKSKPKYKWSPNDVCLNTQPSLHRLWLFQVKRGECKYSRKKYIYKCNNDYCGLDKRSCEGLSKKSIGVKKCVN